MIMTTEPWVACCIYNWIAAILLHWFYWLTKDGLSLSKLMYVGILGRTVYKTNLA